MRTIDVFVVEDDSEDVYLLKKCLSKDSKRHFSVTSIPDLTILAERLNAFTPDVILLDLGLPESSGLETLVRVKQITKNIAIIVLTGLDDKYGEQAISLGAQDYIPKAELTPSNISRSIRFTLERFQLLNDIRNKIDKDPLTLLHNRRAFDEEIERLLALKARLGGEFAIMSLDLNKFKDVNDTYGHLAGDQVLEQIGSRLRLNTRRSDLVARIGGDEFAILIPDFNEIENLTKLAQEKIKGIEESCMIYTDKKILQVQVGASIGIATYPANGQTKNELLEAADKAMYSVKKQKDSDFKFSE
ncbi:GGDEF domain-containing response regulator [Algibacillus agarilyticus]|uniref:GGDEF domain-containing response regulator n=1 Tax=Algibacillus agarilyticus TaxID=2234133 RepID=UPI000DD01C58|nr:GGDEF domain-containing response regulator [Algibacillus agarilyticus]